MAGGVINVDLRAQPYDARLKTLLAHGIGLRDVIADAERKGNLDSSIRNNAHNPLASFVSTLPALRIIAFTGGTAARIGGRQLKAVADRYELIDVPSSSPANAVKLENNLRIWSAIRWLSNQPAPSAHA